MTIDDFIIVGLMPIRNEEWIIDFSLRNLSKICNEIIIADQNSDDKSRDICCKFKNVTIIENKENFHSNNVRKLLLNFARKKYSGKSVLYINVDADEIIPFNNFRTSINHYLKISKPGDNFSLKWLQVSSSLKDYNYSGVWKNNWKPCIFIDHKDLSYSNNFIINDHSSRVPLNENSNNIKITNLYLLHFQWIFLENSQFKQIWYMCHELLLDKSKSNEINKKYYHSLNFNHKLTKKLDSKILEGNILNYKYFKKIDDTWHKLEIVKLFEEYGSNFFEKLDIWHNEYLRKIFYKQNKRYPSKKNSFYKIFNKLFIK